MIHRGSCQAAVLSNALQPGCSSHQLCVVIHNVDKRAASLFSVASATHCGCFTHNIANCCAVCCCAVLHLRRSGLWRVRSWSPRMDLVPEFLCSVQGMTGMVADIALSSNGGEQAAAAAAAYVVLPCYSYCRSASRRHPRTEAPPQEHHYRHLSNACETNNLACWLYCCLTAEPRKSTNGHCSAPQYPLVVCTLLLLLCLQMSSLLTWAATSTSWAMAPTASCSPPRT